MSPKYYDHRRPPTNTKRLTADITENNGIVAGETFNTEREFHQFIADWLDGRKIRFVGNRSQETPETKSWNKQRIADITEVELEPSTPTGFGDIGIHHNFLHLAWNHALASPFIIECKLKDSFRYAVEQAVRYKEAPQSKYQEEGQYKFVQTGIVTPRSLSTGEIAGRHTDNPDDQSETSYVYPINFEAKRIYWKLSIGVIQSINPDQIVISFGESDVVVIE